MGVEIVKDSDGNAHLGGVLDGEFVSFATIPAHRLAHHAERVATLRERADQGDDQASKALASLPQSGSTAAPADDDQGEQRQPYGELG